MVDLQLKIPKDFLQTEVRSDHTVDSSMKEVWAVQLDLLVKLLEVCKKHDIEIFASSGTVIGAVRHGGFIPWDDDIDLMLMRDQYDKLCEVAEQEFSSPYFFQTEYNDPGSLRRHAQLRNSDTTAILRSETGYARFNQGIFIDIFPMDAVPDNEADFIAMCDEADALMRRIYKFSDFSTRYNSHASSGIKGLIKKVIRPIAVAADKLFKIEQRMYKKYEGICARYNHLPTKEVAMLSAMLYDRRQFKLRSDFDETVWMDFEFVKIPVPSGYDRMLRAQYGDYMKIVKSPTVHGGVIFDAGKPYTEYLEDMGTEK